MRRFLWLFILWQVFWLNIFLPGHTRGAFGVTACEDCTATAAPADDAEPSCCAVKHNSPEPKQPTETQKRNCAICYFAKGYTLPVVYVFDLTLHGRVIARLESTRPQVDSIDFGFPYYPVGPPAGPAC